jgi:hypothetical protein
MNQASVKFADIQDAFDLVSFGDEFMEREAFVCKERGKIYWRSEFDDDEDEPLPEDIDDDEKYIAIPHKNDFNLGKNLVLRFSAEQLPDSYDKVREIFSRRGAYARFKDLLEYQDMLQQWYDYEQQAGGNALREWCNDCDIKIAD